ncbi:hypothetical protein CSIM01_02311 [Colletotrichum simmondsii]|uniref:J domain-containing protein n=1 Tax=Colletotrichum simmondsii TaxID=703756 RepID=A0A135SDJ2_9PEZI|nr:hypothetical protein CSIM01_02311 [Colletotrichum simmondsii]
MDPPTPTDQYVILGVGNDATQEHTKYAFHGVVERARQYSQHVASDRAGRSRSTNLASSSRNQDPNRMLTRRGHFSVYQTHITTAYKVLSDPLLRARYDKSRQPIVRAKSLRLRKFSVWKRRTSDDDVPEIASIKQKLKEKLKKGKKKLEAALETAAHKAKEAEVRQKSRWPEVLATPREKSFYQQPAMSRPQPRQLENKYHAEEREETPMIYEDVCKTPKGHQVRDRNAITDLYNGNSHSFNEAVEPRELTTRSPPNKARLVPPGRQPGCMDNGPHGWEGWYPTNKDLSPPDCPICEEFNSKFFY